MRIAICSSASFAKRSQAAKEELEKKGFEVLLYPQSVRVDNETLDIGEYYMVRKRNVNRKLLMVKKELMDEHFEKIRNSDAVLILNFDRPRIKGYVGGNTFLEMGIAYFLGKKIFIWKEPSEALPYYEEIATIEPINIEEDLGKIA